MKERFKRMLLWAWETKFTLTAVTAVVAAAVYCAGGNNLFENTVMITNATRNHGGTGVILSSSDTESRILTNSHVCGVVEKGGVVSGQAGAFMVTSYKRSQVHDLCLITVAGNMQSSTKIANRPPTPFYEEASISGHPGLMPSVITKGHFSGRSIIEVTTGIKKCDENDLADPSKMMYCIFAGGIPQFRRYESVLVTATIMPGSSGSGVYNKSKELSGLAFAGSGEIGYAWTVPYEALRNFLDKEEASLAKAYPNNDIDMFSNESEKRGFDEVEVTKKLRQMCIAGDRANRICSAISADMVYIK